MSRGRSQKRNVVAMRRVKKRKESCSRAPWMGRRFIGVSGVGVGCS
jgi:hypothetical protein